MFEKYRIRKNRFLPVLYRVMEGQEFGRILAEQVLKELCALLGDKVDFVLFVSAKNVENYVFSTFPEDEPGTTYGIRKEKAQVTAEQGPREERH